MTTDEVAGHFDVSVATVRRWIARGDLEAERQADRSLRVPRRSVVALDTALGDLAAAKAAR
jgi:excisionase family DNA binding protein